MIINLFNFSKREIFFSLPKESSVEENKKASKKLKKTATDITSKAFLDKNPKNLFTKENAAKSLIGGTLAAGGLTSAGFGIGKIMEEYQKTSNDIFSQTANQYHTIYNKYKDILSTNGSLSMLKNENFTALAGNEKLLNALSSGKPAGLKDLIGNSNFNKLLTDPAFTNILSSGNLASLDLLLKNQGIFESGNLANIQIIMGNSKLQDLLKNSEFKNLLSDQKFLEMIKSPDGLSAFYSSPASLQGIMQPEYTKFLNDPKIKEILSNSNIQELLKQEGMTDLLKNPNFFALFSDPNLKPMLNNPAFHELLGNVELTKLLGNKDTLALLRDPKVLEMISAQGFSGMLENPAFAQMIKDPTKLMEVMKDPQLEGYMNAASKVGISTADIAGIIALVLSGITLVGAGVLVFSKMKNKGKNQGKEENQIEKVSIFTKIIDAVKGMFSKKTVTGKELGELSKALTDLKSSLSREDNLIKNTFDERKLKDSFSSNQDLEDSFNSDEIQSQNSLFFSNNPKDIENLVNKLQENLKQNINTNKEVMLNANEILAMNNIIKGSVKDAFKNQKSTYFAEQFNEKIDEIAKDVISQIGKLEVGSKIDLGSIEKGIKEDKGKGGNGSGS